MIAHIDLDAFFASVEQRDNPSLVSKPVIVAFVTPQGTKCNRGVVSACSYEARSFGVSNGMNLAKAKKLCPTAAIISGNFGKYDQASRQMYQILENYTPAVEPVGLDEAFLDFSGTELIYPNLKDICWQIKKEIKEKIGITASIGLASNKVVAKIASKFEKPDGLTIIPKGTEKEFLAHLPINKLYGIGDKISSKLIALGVTTIGNLTSLPKDLVIKIFGKYGETIWYWANGIDGREVTPPPPRKSIGASITFLKNSNDKSYILAHLRYLAEKVASQLRREGKAGFCQKIVLRDENFQTWSHQKILSCPVKTSKEVFEIGKILLNSAWDGKTTLRLVGMAVANLKTEILQPSIFDDSAKWSTIDAAVDKIRAKFGFWAIKPASILTCPLGKNQDQK